MNRLIRWRSAAILGFAAALAAAAPAPRKAWTPTLVFTNPVNGQTVTTLRNSEGSPTLGSVTAATGINRCTVEYKRVSDSYYWNGTAWASTVFVFTPAITNVNPSPPYYTFRENAGPSSASMTSGAQYLVYAECVETNGTRASTTVTVTRA